MICSNCGFQNEGTPKFCMKCGNAMAQPMQQPIQDVQPIQDNNLGQQPIQQNNNFGGATSEFMNSAQVQSQPIQNPTANEFATPNVQPTQSYETGQTSTGSLNYIFFILAVLLKPVTSIKEELHKFEDTKTSLIFASLVAGATTLITLVKTIYSTVYIKASSGFFGYGATEAKWAWENLKEVKWLEVIFKNFLVYAGILVAIALVYYLASLILKKTVNFKRLLGVASIALIPIVIIIMIVSPLASMLWAELGLILTVVGALYGGAILIYGLNEEMALENNDMKIYVNVICMSILIIAGSYIMMRVALGSVSSGGLDVFDFLK